MAEKYTLEHVVELCNEFIQTENDILLGEAFMEAAFSENRVCETLGVDLIRAIAKNHSLSAKLKQMLKIQSKQTKLQ